MQVQTIPLFLLLILLFFFLVTGMVAPVFPRDGDGLDTPRCRRAFIAMKRLSPFFSFGKNAFFFPPTDHRV